MRWREKMDRLHLEVEALKDKEIISKEDIDEAVLLGVRLALVEQMILFKGE